MTKKMCRTVGSSRKIGFVERTAKAFCFAGSEQSVVTMGANETTAIEGNQRTPLSGMTWSGLRFRMRCATVSVEQRLAVSIENMSTMPSRQTSITVGPQVPGINRSD